MSTERARRRRELFEQGEDLPSPARERLLATSCQDDPSLAAELAELWDHAGRSGTPLDAPLVAGIDLDALIADEDAGPLPERIGNYRVVRLLGRGSMGTVYEAVQENPRRTVALKVLRAGMATAAAQQRFQLEADVLGRLDHPDIASIYEAGVADLGAGPRPFLAMEFVDGERLDSWVAHHAGLDVRERLRLVARIGRALAHAHQRGVIHRDVKPGNVMVDAEGRPRVLDFGVARTVALDPASDGTRETRRGQLLGTLQYMSPEQAGGDPRAVDVRADVYSLGVLGYELLAGRPPYDLTNTSLPEALQRITYVDGESLGDIDSAFRGDVATIFARALEKDPQRRYQSMPEFIGDIERHLADEPITARPTSTSERLAKFVRRNRALVTGATTGFVLLVLGLVAMAFGLVEANDQAELAGQRLVEENRARQAATDALGEARAARQSMAAALADAEQAGTRAERAHEETQQALAEAEQARERMSVALTDAEQARAQMQRALADAEQARAATEVALDDARIANAEMRVALDEADTVTGFVGHLITAVNPDDYGHDVLVSQVLANAAELTDSQFDGRPHLAARIYSTIGLSYSSLSDHPAAAEHLEKAWRLSRAAFGEDDQRTLRRQSQLADALGTAGDRERAHELATAALEGFERQGLATSEAGLEAALAVGYSLHDLQRTQAAADQLETTLAAAEAAQGAGSIIVTRVKVGLAAVRVQQGRPDLAEPLLTSALQALGANPASTGNGRFTLEFQLATVLIHLQRYAEAGAALDLLFESELERRGDEHPTPWRVLGLRADVHFRTGNFQAALELYERANPKLIRMYGSAHLTTVIQRRRQASVLIELDRLDEAEQILVEQVALLEQGDAPQAVVLATTLRDLGAIFMRRLEYGFARDSLERGLAIMEQHYGPDSLHLADFLMDLSALEAQEAHWEAAEAHGQRARRLYESALGPTSIHALNLRTNLARMDLEQGRVVEAEAELLQVIPMLRQVLGDEHPSVLQSVAWLARVFYVKGDLPRSAQLFQVAIRTLERTQGDSLVLRVMRREYADTLVASESWDEAETLARAQYAERLSAVGRNDFETVQDMLRLASILLHTDRHEKAGQLLAGMQAWAEAAPPSAVLITINLYYQLGSVEAAQQRPDAAEALLRRSLELASEHLGPDSTDALLAEQALAQLDEQRRALAEAASADG